jgi:hypothetical protein
MRTSRETGSTVASNGGTHSDPESLTAPPRQYEKRLATNRRTCPWSLVLMPVVEILLLLLLLLLLPAVIPNVVRASAKAWKAAGSDDSTAAETPYQEQRPRHARTHTAGLVFGASLLAQEQRNS